MQPSIQSRERRFFLAVTARPRRILALSAAALLACAAFAPRLTKDSSNEAFTPDDHPAVLLRDRVKETFGLHDPVVIAVVNERHESGVFNPRTLRLVQWLTDAVAAVPGVDPDRVTSLATEKDLIGEEDGIRVEPFFESPPETQAQADRIREAVLDLELYAGRLVARDGSATLIVAELLDTRRGQEVYEAIRARVGDAPLAGETVHVAGAGAIDGVLGAYIDGDARRLNPVAAFAIAAVLFASYRTLRGVLLPLLVAAGAIAAALGTMAALGIPFFVITSALTIILIGIGVCDGIHILGRYYLELAERPDAGARETVVRTMVAMWRPVTITSITTIAGFLGLGFATFIPPMRAFGAFAALGVAVALLLSLFTLPAALTLLRARPSRAFAPAGAAPRAGVDRFGRVTGAVGRWVIRGPRLVLAGAAALAALALVSSFSTRVENDPIEGFQPTEPIYLADRAINRTLDGTYHLDLVVEADERNALYSAARLRRIEAMQAFAESLPHVSGSISLVDHLKAINRALHADAPEASRVPDDPDVIAQQLLLYSMSGGPTQLEEVVDYDFRLANVRLTMDTGRYSDATVVIEQLERYLRDEFDGDGLRATIAGAVHLDYRYMKDLVRSHVRGVALAFFGVWLAAALSFRSLAAGALALVPVALAVLMIYAVMGLAGIWFRAGTAMCAAIAIGLGVDFAVHVLDRLIQLVKGRGVPLEDALSLLFTFTGRALLFNFAAVLLGFGVLMSSYSPQVVEFGLLVCVCVASAFAASLTVLPALLKVVRPALLGRSVRG